MTLKISLLTGFGLSLEPCPSRCPRPPQQLVHGARMVCLALNQHARNKAGDGKHGHPRRQPGERVAFRRRGNRGGHGAVRLGLPPRDADQVDAVTIAAEVGQVVAEVCPAAAAKQMRSATYANHGRCCHSRVPQMLAISPPVWMMTFSCLISSGRNDGHPCRRLSSCQSANERPIGASNSGMPHTES